ncbi:hypothetical protein OUZ56_002656 [Daphnia magna]|uniref:Uncharacterized protein n=1 Tax=Daphnia magna TaxID=35525 RepID=A0ABR0A6G5_9CRUS|nr:hypothetical protein OUZ56_002656 [Daphnia magna]
MKALPLLSSAKNQNVGINLEDESCTQVEFPELIKAVRPQLHRQFSNILFFPTIFAVIRLKLRSKRNRLYTRYPSTVVDRVDLTVKKIETMYGHGLLMPHVLNLLSNPSSDILDEMANEDCSEIQNGHNFKYEKSKFMVVCSYMRKQFV